MIDQITPFLETYKPLRMKSLLRLGLVLQYCKQVTQGQCRKKFYYLHGSLIPPRLGLHISVLREK